MTNAKLWLNCSIEDRQIGEGQNNSESSVTLWIIMYITVASTRRMSCYNKVHSVVCGCLSQPFISSWPFLTPPTYIDRHAYLPTHYTLMHTGKHVKQTSLAIMWHFVPVFLNGSCTKLYDALPFWRRLCTLTWWSMPPFPMAKCVSVTERRRKTGICWL